MRTETAEAFARLVAIYVNAIEGAGRDLPENLEAKMLAAPLKTCEELNALALRCGAVDDQTDIALAAIYESMDAADARSEVTDNARIRLTRTIGKLVRPKPKPEPVAAPAAEPVAAPAAEPVAAPAAEPVAAAEQPKAEAPADGEKPAGQGTRRRRGRKPKSGEQRTEKPVQEQEAGAVTEPAGMPTAEPVADPTAAAAPEPAATPETAAKTEPAAVVAPEPAAAPEAAAKTEPAAVPEAEPTPEAEPDRSKPTLTVDQSAAILGVNKQEIYKLIKAGSLPAYKQGRSWRIDAEAVQNRAAAK